MVCFKHLAHHYRCNLVLFFSTKQNIPEKQCTGIVTTKETTSTVILPIIPTFILDATSTVRRISIVMLIRTFAEVTDFLAHEKKEYPLVISTLAVMCGRLLYC